MSRLLSEAVAAFKANDVKFAYSMFSDTVKPPYAFVHEYDLVRLASDDEGCLLLMDYTVVLMTEDRDLDLEHRIEAALAAAEITVTGKRGWYDPDRKAMSTYYQFQVIER